MTFASLEFLVFFLIVFLCILLCQKMAGDKSRGLCHVLLLVASYIFYGWWDYRFLALLFGVTLITYLSAVPSGKKYARQRLAVGVVSPLVVLGIFKYFNFFLENLSRISGKDLSPGINIILPVGISFFTFQCLSYAIDVYRGNVNKETNFVRYALYISFFPQLVAGPIVKASEFLPQLYQNRKINLRDLEIGVQIFVFGMFKKLVIADNLSVFVDEIYNMPELFSWWTILLACVSYSIQIYMDFSGYSDMAIGCAKMLGYDLAPNFNLPYLSQNVSEFWKRWHISLSSWLMQYLYIPLGGNRKGKFRTYINLMITMLLGGLWHGANWTFVFWGGIHGLALSIHKGFIELTGGKKNRKKKSLFATIICILLTDIFAGFCWIFFRSDNISTAFSIIRRIITFKSGINHCYSWSLVAILLVAVATLVAVIRQNKCGQVSDNALSGINGMYPIFNLGRIPAMVFLWVEIGLIAGLAYVGGSPFIYFQF